MYGRRWPGLLAILAAGCTFSTHTGEISRSQVCESCSLAVVQPVAQPSQSGHTPLMEMPSRPMPQPASRAPLPKVSNTVPLPLRRMPRLDTPRIEPFNDVTRESAAFVPKVEILPPLPPPFAESPSTLPANPTQILPPIEVPM